MIEQSGFTTDEVAGALGCCRNNTTRKLDKWKQRVMFLIGSFAGLESPRQRRPDNIAEHMIAIMETGAKLDQLDHQRFKLYVQQIAEECLSEPPASGADAGSQTAKPMLLSIRKTG